VELGVYRELMIEQTSSDLENVKSQINPYPPELVISIGLLVVPCPRQERLEEV
jgi:hypothetical protein